MEPPSNKVEFIQLIRSNERQRDEALQEARELSERLSALRDEHGRAEAAVADRTAEREAMATRLSTAQHQHSQASLAAQAEAEVLRGALEAAEKTVARLEQTVVGLEDENKSHMQREEQWRSDLAKRMHDAFVAEAEAEAEAGRSPLSPGRLSPRRFGLLPSRNLLSPGREPLGRAGSPGAVGLRTSPKVSSAMSVLLQGLERRPTSPMSHLGRRSGAEQLLGARGAAFCGSGSPSVYERSVLSDHARVVAKDSLIVQGHIL